MKIIFYLILLPVVAFGTDQVYQEPKVNKTDKEITNQEILETLKQAVKPVELKENSGEPVVIHYDSSTQGLVRSRLGDPTMPTSSDLNLVVSKDDIPEQKQDILNQAYKAALLGQFEASVILYKKALNNAPDDVNILFSLGSLYQQLFLIDFDLTY